MNMVLRIRKGHKTSQYGVLKQLPILLVKTLKP